MSVTLLLHKPDCAVTVLMVRPKRTEWRGVGEEPSQVMWVSWPLEVMLSGVDCPERGTVWATTSSGVTSAGRPAEEDCPRADVHLRNGGRRM